ncbi:putative apoptosis inducing factor [Balamuthia mandrillaris]
MKTNMFWAAALRLARYGMALLFFLWSLLLRLLQRSLFLLSSSATKLCYVFSAKRNKVHSTKADEDEQERVVIVGGGFGGAYVARSLEARFRVTLIDTKTSFEFTPSVLRTAVEPEHLPAIRLPHESYLSRDRRSLLICPAKAISLSLSSPRRVLALLYPAAASSSLRMGEDEVGEEERMGREPPQHIENEKEKEEEAKEKGEDGKEVLVDYDYLVLCPGASYSMPSASSSTSSSNLINHKNKRNRIVSADNGSAVAAAHPNLRKAKEVLIVGGGIVGVELAAEIVERFPLNTKRVTLVHAGSHLMSRSSISSSSASSSYSATSIIPNRAHEYAERFLSSRGVHLVFNERVVHWPALEDENEKEEMVFTTDKGTRLTADICYLCTGLVPNSSFLRQRLWSSSSPASSPKSSNKDSDKPSLLLDEKGFLQVNQHLQALSSPSSSSSSSSVALNRVYGLGDVIRLNDSSFSPQEEKLAQSTEWQAAVVVHNIIAASNERKRRKRKEKKDDEDYEDKAKRKERAIPGLKRYRASNAYPILISLGKYDGMLVWLGWTLTGFLPALMKEFVEWKGLK